MPFATPPRLLRACLLLLLVAFTGLVSSCQSTRPSFSFQPIPSQAIAAEAPPVANEPTAPTVADSTEAVVTMVAPITTAIRPARLPRRQRVASAAPLKQAIVASVGQRLGQRLHRKPTTDGAAESGLGRSVLFILAVVLGVLAGLAVLVSLIPGISFWGGLGLVVGGLLVLGLLYKVLSGKKK